MRRIVLVGLLCVIAPMAVAEISEKIQKKLDSAESTFQAAVRKADNTRFYAIQKANGDRLKVLKQTLNEATKGGDFDAAAAIKGLLEAAESQGVIREKPKNTAKFAGHEYALIPDKVTWYTAKRRCEEMGGHLLVAEVPQELAFVKPLCQGATAWVGATDHETEDRYVWITGIPVDMSRVAANREAAGAADVLMFESSNNALVDYLSGMRAPFICEWE